MDLEVTNSFNYQRELRTYYRAAGVVSNLQIIQKKSYTVYIPWPLIHSN